MSKTASTKEIIEHLQAYEKLNGVGSVECIGSVCSGSRNIEYIFCVKNKYGKETKIEIPTIEEECLFG